MPVAFVLSHPAPQQVGVKTVLQRDRSHGDAGILAGCDELYLESGIKSPAPAPPRSALIDSVHVSTNKNNGHVCSYAGTGDSMCVRRALTLVFFRRGHCLKLTWIEKAGTSRHSSYVVKNTQKVVGQCPTFGVQFIKVGGFFYGWQTKGCVLLRAAPFSLHTSRLWVTMPQSTDSSGRLPIPSHAEQHPAIHLPVWR